ncbi:MAG: SpoIID/LytB domain-containing protein [Acidimicrobiia bacterium]
MVGNVRPFRLLLVLAVLLGLLPLTQTALAGIDDWEFDGGGWGHGVGLSQFGALGQAQDGRTADQILAYYYAGTEITSPLPPDHWINTNGSLLIGLVSNTTTVDVSAIGGQVRVCQPTGCSGDDSGNGHVDRMIDPGVFYQFEIDANDPSQCRFRTGVDPDGWNGGYGPCDAEVRQDQGTATRIKVNTREYAHGTVRLTPASSGFHAVLATKLEDYLYGLSEVPSYWPSEALKTQAIIGRSYAVATALERGGMDGSNKLSSCGCHLRNSTADQVFIGWGKEDPGRGGASWTQAVNDTAGQALIHPDSGYPMGIAKAFYSSSNGGWSENVEDVWGGDPLAWLRATEDPWSADPSVNPLANWAILVNTDDVAAYLGWDKVFTGILVDGPPGAMVRFTGKDGGAQVTKDLNGTQIRSLLNLYGFRTDGQPVRVSPYISAVTDPPGFNDIDGHIFENAIKWLAFEGITEGCNPPSNTNFCPDSKVTRGEMAVFLSRALQLPTPIADHFNDDTGMFYEGAANRIYEAGITVGCGNGKYCGESLLPREQMAALLARTLSLPVTASDYFEDDAGSQFEGAINKIAEAQITLGCNPPINDRFCPKDYVTRGQMAAFFKRAWGP